MDLDIPSLISATFYAPDMDSLFCTQEEMGTQAGTAAAMLGVLRTGQLASKKEMLK